MRLTYWLLAVVLLSSAVAAQTVSLRGQVTDQNGAVISAARVTVNGPSGLVKTTTADDAGHYSFAGLRPGDYAIDASAPNLTLQEPAKITLKSAVQTLDTFNPLVPGSGVLKTRWTAMSCVA